MRVATCHGSGHPARRVGLRRSRSGACADGGAAHRRQADHPASPAAATRRRDAATSDDEIFSRIERLAELRQKGILTDEEFAAKKTELLARL